VEDDVIGIKSRIEKMWPVLEVIYDQVDNEWVIIEHCRDGIERFVFSERVLGEHTIQRLQRADGNTEFLDQIDAHNEEVKKERDRQFNDEIGDFAQRFAHALKQDGFYNHEDIFGVSTRGSR
jgi:hypothetical protein